MKVLPIATRFLLQVSEAVDRKWGWDKIGLPLGLLTLIGVRDKLREDNLYDAYDAQPPPAPQHDPSEYLNIRTIDGSYNDLGNPSMGMAGTRFGRNVPLNQGRAEQQSLLDPNPRTVSTELLLRDTFKPAGTLNILAAAWLQFETRDWFHHGTSKTEFINVPRPEGDPWPEDPILMPATPPDPTQTSDQVTTFLNEETHWWDASQIYGSTPEFQAAVRSDDDGKVRIGADGLIDIDPALLGASGGIDGWWAGLEMMATVFMREHNAICDHLKAAYPEWTDDQLFHKARLINAALIAKIHTIEWTPAILGHPVLQIGMRANWFGIAGERVYDLFGRLSSSEVVSGIPGSPTAHHAAPYSITEDFVTVYRMHPLIPDDYVFSDPTGRELLRCEFESLRALNSHQFLQEQVSPAAALYSLGVENPGAVVLHNSPTFMHNLARREGGPIDLTAIDILRSRERGVPRYNDFRRALRLRPATNFEEISDGPETTEQLSEIYGGDIEKVDTSVGMFGEPVPEKFGFSDTAFRIFVLMASRRLKSDRFYTVDFTPRVYTPEGMKWLDDNTMVTVLMRHYPELRPVLQNQRNAFAPWQPRVSAG